jgi:hypothetical protein
MSAKLGANGRIVTVKLKSLLAASVMAIAVIAVAGCSSSSKSSASDTTTTVASGKASVCTARANLKQSVTALASPSLLTGGKAGIQSALDTVKTNLDAVSTSAQDVYKPQVDATKSAVSDLETAVSKIGSGSPTQTLQAVGTAITKVGTTSAALVTTLTAACPSS